MNRFICCMLLGFLLAQHQVAVAQWVSAGTVTNIGSYPSVSVDERNIAWIAGGPSTGTPVIYRTYDGGTTWTATGTTGLQLEMYCVWAPNATTAFVGNGGVAGVFTGGNAKFFRTLDAGTTWSLVDSTGGTAGFFNGIVFSKTHPEFGIAQSDPPTGAGQAYYVSKTTDGGLNWIRTNPPGVAGNISAASIFVIDKNFYGFGLNPSAQIYMTTDGGTTWNVHALGLTRYLVSGLAFSDNKLNGIAVTDTSLPNIARTTDGGITWTVINVGAGMTGHATAKWITGTNVCYLSGTTGIKKSTDAGLTWSAMTTPAITGLYHMEFARIGTNVFGYAVTNSGTVIKLAEVVSGISDSLYVSFSLGASPLSSITGVLFGDQCDSVRILNLAFTWHSHFPPVQIQPLDWKAGRNENRIQNFPLPPAAPGFPEDAHAVYVIYPGGTPQTLDIDSLVAGKRYVLGPPCSTTDVGDESRLPQRVQLSQNFPNPFNPTTTITYALPSETNVSLVIYDMLGREVVRLVNNMRQRAGYYEMQWNGRDAQGIQMPSGTYFIRLEAERYTETRKLLLLK